MCFFHQKGSSINTGAFLVKAKAAQTTTLVLLQGQKRFIYCSYGIMSRFARHDPELGGLAHS